MVSGNYAKPRLLAELAQKKTGQPIILISPTDGGEELFMLPATGEALAEQKGKFVEMIEWLHPKQVIFLGDSDYMPAQYVELVRSRFPVVVVSGEDWVKNAESLAATMHLGKWLPKRYTELLKILDEAIVRRPLTSMAPAPVAEPELPEATAAPAAEEPAPAPATEPEPRVTPKLAPAGT